MRHYKSLGFTLIELLIAVVIIGILATSITISVTGQQAKAQDSRRLADWRTMEKTIAAFYTDNFIYPPETYCDSSYGTDNNNFCPPLGTGRSSPLGQWGRTSLFYNNLVPKYIATLPVDPINNTSYYYLYEPSDNPVGQCFYWIFYTESGGRAAVRNDIGDLKDADGILQSTCDF